MSHEFRLVCKTCNLETEEVNHANENIKSFVNKWEENRNALDVHIIGNSVTPLLSEIICEEIKNSVKYV